MLRLSLTCCVGCVIGPTPYGQTRRTRKVSIWSHFWRVRLEFCTRIHCMISLISYIHTYVPENTYAYTSKSLRCVKHHVQSLHQTVSNTLFKVLEMTYIPPLETWWVMLGDENDRISDCVIGFGRQVSIVWLQSERPTTKMRKRWSNTMKWFLLERHLSRRRQSLWRRYRGASCTQILSLQWLVMCIKHPSKLNYLEKPQALIPCFPIAVDSDRGAKMGDFCLGCRSMRKKI